MPAQDAQTVPSPAVEAAPKGGGLDRILASERRCVLTTAALCSLPLLLGLAVGYTLVASGWLPVEAGIGAKFEADLARRLGMGWTERFWAIARPNFTCFAIFMVGIVTLGLEATVHLGFLGVCTGIAIGKLTAAGIALGKVLTLLLPHAGPELAGFLLAGSLGYRAGLMFVRYLRGGTLVLPGERKRMARVAAGAFGLLLAAAFVESIVTPAMAALRGVGPFPW